MKEDSPDNSAEQEPTAQEARGLIEQAFLLGVGAAALTKDKVQSVIDDFVARGRLSDEDGRTMVAKLAERGREEVRTATSGLDRLLRGAYRDLGLGTKNDLEDIDFRLRQIEHRLYLLESREDRCTGDKAS